MKGNLPNGEHRVLDCQGATEARRQSRFSWWRVFIAVGIVVVLFALYLYLYSLIDSYWFRHWMGWV